MKKFREEIGDGGGDIVVRVVGTVIVGAAGKGVGDPNGSWKNVLPLTLRPHFSGEPHSCPSHSANSTDHPALICPPSWARPKRLGMSLA